MSFTWVFSLRIDCIPLQRFAGLLQKIEDFFNRNENGLFWNKFNNFDFIIPYNGIESSIEISELQIEGRYDFAHEALEEFKKIIWEHEYIPFEFGAEIKEAVTMTLHDIKDYNEFKKYSRVINLFKISNKIYNSYNSFQVFCTDEILNYVKSNHEIEIDKNLLENEIENYDTLKSERLDPANKNYFEMIEIEKKKISERFKISFQTVERIKYLYDQFIFEYEKNPNFESIECKKINDLKIFFSKQQDRKLGNFYLISNQPLLTNKS